MDPCLGKRKRKINASVHQKQTIGFERRVLALRKFATYIPGSHTGRQRLGVLLTVCLAAKKMGFSPFFFFFHFEGALGKNMAMSNFTPPLYYSPTYLFLL